MIHFNSKIANLLLFRGYIAIMLFGHVFIRDSREKTKQETVNHENIHVEQWKEMMLSSFIILNLPFVGHVDLGYIACSTLVSFFSFYIWYFVEYIVRLVITRSHDKAYYGVCFEREAYKNQKCDSYIKNRSYFSFMKYV